MTSRLPLLASWGVIGVAIVSMAWLSWRKWPDLVVDFGMQLYLPWQISEGSVLYRDVMYLTGGPLSQYYHALLFWLFGPSLNVLIASNLALLLIVLIALHRLLRRSTDLLTTTVVCLVVVLIFAFAQYGRIGNFNYIAPYSHEVLHGLYLSIATIAALCSWWRKPGGWKLACAGLSFGAVFLTKPDVFVALAVTVLLGLVLAARQKLLNLKATTVFTAATLAVPAGFLIYFLSQQGLTESVRAVAWAWVPLLTTSAAQSDFYVWGMGLDRFAEHAQKVFVYFFVAGLVLALCIRLSHKPPRTASQRILTILVVGLLIVGATSINWLDSGYSLPLLTVTTIILLAYRFRTSIAEERIRFVFPLLWSVFSLGMLAKLGVFPRLWQYGFVLAMPATVTALYLALELLPKWGGKVSVHPWFYRTIILFLLLIGVFDLTRSSESIYGLKNFSVGAGPDRIEAFHPRVDPMSRSFKEALQWISTHVAPEQTFASVPEGVMLNYLSRHKSSVPYLVINPTELQAFGEEKVIRAYEKSPPDYIMIVRRSAAEFGVGDFGQPNGFGIDLMEWIKANYDMAQQFPGIWILKHSN